MCEGCQGCEVKCEHYTGICEVCCVIVRGMVCECAFLRSGRAYAVR